MKRFWTIALMLAVAASSLLLNACNTTRGVGEDIEKGGSALKHSAERHGAD
jgi:predicted small secreted protein